jgi:hypothetical protein
MNLLNTRKNKFEVKFNYKKKEVKYFYFLLFSVLFVILFIGIVLAANWMDDYFGPIYITEDSPYFYNLSANITSYNATTMTFAVGDILDGGSESPRVNWDGSLVDFSTISSWVNLNGNTGNLTFNAIRDNQTGNFSIQILVYEGVARGAIFNFIILASNDAPNFTLNAGYNTSIIQTNNSYNFNLVGSDEEEQYPLIYNLSFGGCQPAIWSSRLGSPNNCDLSYQIINSSNNTSILNFTSLIRDDVGIYNLTICVQDNVNGVVSPVYKTADYDTNKTTCKNTSLTIEQVLTVNASDCNNKLLQENQSFSCIINIIARGEHDNLIAWSNATLRNNVSVAIINSSWFFSSNDSNLDNFIQSYYVNVTPAKKQIGNWTINFTVKDKTTGENSTTILFIFTNRTLNSVPSISPVTGLNNLTVFVNFQNETYFNVSDDDLLILDKIVYDETISFTWDILNRSNLIQHLNLSNFSVISSGTGLGVINNIIRAKIRFIANSSEAGNYTINITAFDKENARSELLFNLTILPNTAPIWNESLNTTLLIYEDNNTYLNLSSYVSDSQGDTITFSFTNDTAFPSFNMSSSTGIINFTVRDIDVGQHMVNITTSDGDLASVKEFNFTIYNVNDNPTIDSLITSGVRNATVDANSNINISGYNTTTIILWIYDDDIKIPSEQKSFYNESLTLNLTIEGNNTLFSFTKTDAFPTSSFPNKIEYITTFTPQRAGIYNVTINVTDANNSSTMLGFNLTVFVTRHNPTLTNVLNQTASLMRTFNYNFSVNDIEDGNSSKEGNYNFTFVLNDSRGILNFNSTNFNSTTGILSILFNDSQAGVHRIYLNVTDQDGDNSSTSFWLKVYNVPNVTFPNTQSIFNISENLPFNFTFAVNHSVGDSLNYSFYLNSLLLNSSYNPCNGSNWTFYLTPNFTQESYGDYSNLSLYVFNLIYPELNYTSMYYLNISHTNYPLENYYNISNSSSSSSVTLNLANYFRDIDAVDNRINQTIRFNSTLINLTSGSINITFNDWINGSTPNVTFSSSSSSFGIYSITAYEYNESNSSQIVNTITSNNFSIQLSITVEENIITVNTGGGGSQERKVSMKIVVPSMITINNTGKTKFNITLDNDGEVNFNNISIEGYLLGDSKRFDAPVIFDQNNLKSLASGKKESISVTVSIEDPDILLYEVVINVTSKTPAYNVYNKVFITFDKNLAIIKKIIAFTEGLINENAECIELKDMLDDAKEELNMGNIAEAGKKAQAAMEACKRTIEGLKKAQAAKVKEENMVKYAIIAIVLAIVLGLLFNIYRQIRFRGWKKFFHKNN